MSQKLDRFHKYLNLYQKLVKVNAGNFVDDQLAEDVAQETFIKMYEHLDFLEDDSVKQWLIVVSGNIAKDYLKKGGKISTDFIETQELEFQVEERVESAEQSFERTERQKAARRLCEAACNLLYDKNPNWYYVVVDSYILDMSSAQIGKVLGMTTGNVDVIKCRAREYLRKKLGKELKEFF